MTKHPLVAVAVGVLTLVVLLMSWVRHGHLSELGALRRSYLEALNAQVNQAIVYEEINKWDFRYLPLGGRGNCVTIAYTKWRELQREGYGDRAKIRICELWSGRMHAFVVVDGLWALDNLQPQIVPVENTGCRQAIFNVDNRFLRGLKD